MRRKITVVGAGNVGATTAQRLAERDYADVVLVDIVEGMPQGKALDLNQAGPVVGYEPNIVGTNGYDETSGSDIVVITSGLPRKPGMSRDDLLAANREIVGGVTKEVAERSPDSIIICVTNPLDAMCHVTLDVSGLSAPARGRHGGHPRLRALSHLPRVGARRLGARRDRLRARRPRRHDGPDRRATRTSPAFPSRRRSTPTRLEEIVQRTRDGGAEVVKLLKSGSAYYAPAAAVAEMVDSIVLDQKRVLPCAAYCDGEYGIDGLFVGVPVKLGKDGVEEIIEIELSDAGAGGPAALGRRGARARRRDGGARAELTRPSACRRRAPPAGGRAATLLARALRRRRGRAASSTGRALRRVAGRRRAGRRSDGAGRRRAARRGRADSLRVVANFAVGYDNIDLEACRERGVVVTNTPDVLTNATAELAVALMLAAARRLGEAERMVRARRLDAAGSPAQLLGRELAGQHGRDRRPRADRHARRGAAARASASRLLYTLAHRQPELEARLGARVHGSSTTCSREADVVTLHVPLDPETRHLIDARALERFKPGAILVNTARGGLVDTDALVAALRDRAAWPLPGSTSTRTSRRCRPSCSSSRTSCSLPTSARRPRTARDGMARLVAENVIAVLEGRAPLTPVS